MKSKYFSILKILLYSIILTLIITLGLTTIYYFTNLDVDPKKLTLFIGIFLFGILGFLYANNKQKKGLICGFGIGFLALLILFIICVLIDYKVDKFTIIKYVIYLTSSTVFGILGVNFKKIIK